MHWWWCRRPRLAFPPEKQASHDFFTQNTVTEAQEQRKTDAQTDPRHRHSDACTHLGLQGGVHAPVSLQLPDGGLALDFGLLRGGDELVSLFLQQLRIQL